MKVSDQPDSSFNSVASDEDMFANSQEPATSSQTAECDSASGSNQSSLGCDWRGTPLSKLPKNTGKELFPPVVVGPHHTVLFKLPVKKAEVPKPWPVKPVDMWDQNHVRMPHSPSSLYPVTPTELRRRWELVQQSLKTTISTSLQLEAAILHYNSKYSDRWDFQAMHSFFSEALEKVETEYFFTNVLPKVIDLALSLPSLVTNGIPLLRQHVTHSISLTQQQISCLLANALLCTYPRRNTSKKHSEYSTFPDINFNRLFNGFRAESRKRMGSLREKLKCLIHYFRRVTIKVPEGVVTYSRHYVSPNDLPVWSDQTSTLPNLYISSSGTIEDEGLGMMEMDFANKFIGGGVLALGCVQEEIRFIICPELILARLFTEVMDDTEAIIITGCERFSTYKGYAETFEWAGNFEDSTQRDEFGRLYCTVVAVDACRFPSAKTQYSAAHINRELNKAYAGFSWGMSSERKESVATGNWGCGAYRGDACLKSLLQLMVAACTGRQLAYFTFGNKELQDQIADMHSFLIQNQVTVGDLWKVICSYNPAHYRYTLYSHIYKAVSSKSIPPPMKGIGAFTSKKRRVKENDVEKPVAKQEDQPEKDYTLSEEQILNSLFCLGDEDKDLESAKPAEAKTLNVQSDKELCLKRLNSSWTNLNESKRDFGPTRPTTSEFSSGTVQHTGEQSRHLSSSEESSSSTRKTKISDYFQPVSNT